MAHSRHIYLTLLGWDLESSIQLGNFVRTEVLNFPKGLELTNRYEDKVGNSQIGWSLENIFGATLNQQKKFINTNKNLHLVTPSDFGLQLAKESTFNLLVLLIYFSMLVMVTFSQSKTPIFKVLDISRVCE